MGKTVQLNEATSLPSRLLPWNSLPSGKVRHPQTNGICERFHKTILQEFYQVAFRRKITSPSRSCNRSGWVAGVLQQRPHASGEDVLRARTPMQIQITLSRSISYYLCDLKALSEASFTILILSTRFFFIESPTF